MNPESKSSQIWWFIGKVLILDFAMVGLAVLLSSYLLSLGILLFVGGIMVGGIGAVLGGPSSIDTLYTKLISRRYHLPTKASVDQRTYIIEHSVATYSNENVMSFAGLIAIVLGIILIVSSK
jgi:hypothetical protein